MKIRTTLILVSLLLAVAQGDDIINWAGNWDVKTLTASDTVCYPDTTIVIQQDVGQITASWVRAKTQPCIEAEIAGKKCTQTVKNLQGNSIGLKITVGKAVIDGTFTVDGNTATFDSNNGASSTYARRKEIVHWVGVWDIITQSDTACSPDKYITLIQDSSSLSAAWTWANPQPYQQAGLAGTAFSKPSLSIPSGNALSVSFEVGSVTVQGMFAVINDQAVFASLNGASATFARRQKLVNWVGTWDLYDSQVGYLIASWTWETSNICTKAGLAGKSFAQAAPIPKGNALFLNFIVGKAYVNGFLKTYGNDKTVFLSTGDGSAYFKRRPQMVN